MSARMSPKRQRLWLLCGALVALGGAGALAATALGDTATFFYSPSDVARHAPAPGETIRLGGLVQPGSVRRGEVMTFAVTDNARTVAVSYGGMPPDLFREGKGVIAEGRFEGGRFVADRVLAKHDENYMPPEVASSLHKVGPVS